MNVPAIENHDPRGHTRERGALSKTGWLGVSPGRETNTPGNAKREVCAVCESAWPPLPVSEGNGRAGGRSLTTR